MIAVCFTVAWLTVMTQTPYGFWSVASWPCYGAVPYSPYTPCEGRKEQ